MKLSELVGRPVISLADAGEVGKVSDVLVDPTYQEVRALAVQAGQGEQQNVVSRDDVRAIGPDAVTIAGKEALRPMLQLPMLGEMVSLASILNKNVLTEGGKVLGTVSAVYLDAGSSRVDHFECDGRSFGGLFGRPVSIAPADLIGVGPRSVTVRQSVDSTKAA